MQSRYPAIDFPHIVGDESDEPIVRHPHWQRFKEAGKKFTFHAEEPHASRPIGNMKVQVIRSSADWSSGILSELFRLLWRWLNGWADCVGEDSGAFDSERVQWVVTSCAHLCQ